MISKKYSVVDTRRCVSCGTCSKECPKTPFTSTRAVTLSLTQIYVLDAVCAHGHVRLTVSIWLNGRQYHE